MEAKERKKHTWMSDEKKRFILELSKFAADSDVARAADLTHTTIGKYSFRGGRMNPSQAPVCYAAMIGNGFTIVHKRPMVIWRKGNAEVTLGFDYLPESIVVNGIEVEFNPPVWTMGELNAIIKKADGIDRA